MWYLSSKEEKKLGYKRVSAYHRVGGYGDDDDLAHRIAKQLREPLLNKETGNFTSEVV